MQHVIRLATAAAGLALLSTPTSAASPDGQFSIRGVGNSSCSSFLGSYRANDAEAPEYRGWLTGYLTAYNYFQAETVDIVPWQSVPLLSALLAQYCERNSEAPFVEAVTQMVNALFDQRLSKDSDVVIASNNGDRVELYRAILQRAQSSLKEKGYYDGEASGEFDQATIDALRDFQSSNDLDPTGLPDHPTLYQIFMK